MPTYRRVEEDLQNLLDIKEEILKGDELIQFGMQDIKKRFEDITSEITKSFVESYSEISGQILTQLVREVDSNSVNFYKIGDLNILNIILDRVGNSIKDEDKTLILDIAKRKQFTNPKYTTLAYFLSKLIDVYEKQENNDNAIKNLVSVVNKYFSDSNKELIYNESKVEIKITDKKSKNGIMVDKLSSGEKQILSIFSKLYLDKTPKSQYIVLIDEPELSLSIEWQRQLLEDIMASSKCALLLATTHSPFVFENKLDKFVTKIRAS